jgi:hypothetical protein
VWVLLREGEGSKQGSVGAGAGSGYARSPACVVRESLAPHPPDPIAAGGWLNRMRGSFIPSKRSSAQEGELQMLPYSADRLPGCLTARAGRGGGVSADRTPRLDTRRPAPALVHASCRHRQNRLPQLISTLRAVLHLQHARVDDSLQHHHAAPRRLSSSCRRSEGGVCVIRMNGPSACRLSWMCCSAAAASLRPCQPGTCAQDGVQAALCVCEVRLNE